MTGTATPTADRTADRPRYRPAMYGSLAVGVAGHLIGLRADLPVAALAVYWAGVLGSVGVWKGNSAALYDERHERPKAQSALKLVGAVLVAVAPAAPALAAAGYDLPAVADGVLYGYGAVFGVYAVTQLRG